VFRISWNTLRKKSKSLMFLSALYKY
jgi:hypothetical protein